MIWVSHCESSGLDSNQAILFMIVKDQLPRSFIDSQGFNVYIKSLEARFKSDMNKPCRNTLTKKAWKPKLKDLEII